MLFNSFSFIFAFLPTALIGFFLLSRLGQRYAAMWLILASFTFYGIWNPRFIVLLLLSIGFNFTIGELLRARAGSPRQQRVILAFGIGCDLLVLTYFKYLYALLNFISSAGLLHLHVPPVVLPLGISFFTFTQIGYIVDVQQDMTHERGFLNYLLFVTFFPHLIAGPILHNRDIMPQFARAETYRFSVENLSVGAVIFIIGLAKKCLLADPLSADVHTGFSAPDHLQFFGAWITAVSFAFQLYFDFSGYSDMALGLARMFNLSFPINFNSPFKALCTIDHWNRWHMTLSRFLNQYLFSPIALAVVRFRAARGMGINRTAQHQPAAFLSMVAFPLLVTMGLAGIWHGAGIQFLIFGLLQGFYLTVNHAWRIIYPPTNRKPHAVVRVASLALTFVAALIALVFLRSPTIACAGTMLSAMAGLHGFDWSSTMIGNLAALAQGKFGQWGDAVTFAKSAKLLAQQCLAGAWLAFLCVIIWACPNTQEFMSKYTLRPGAAPTAAISWRPTIGWAAAIAALSVTSLLAISGTTEFLYYRF